MGYQVFYLVHGNLCQFSNFPFRGIKCILIVNIIIISFRFLKLLKHNNIVLRFLTDIIFSYTLYNLTIDLKKN